MEIVYDFGLFDAADTRYYLEEGYKVVAVEANPALARNAELNLETYIQSGQLHVVNAAISDCENVELTVCGDDLGSSSIFQSTVQARWPLGSVAVKGITTEGLMEKYGTPYFLKVDIEGADGICVRSLSSQKKPKYLSFEMGEDFEELLNHVESIGFNRFKIINQCNFRELSNENNIRDRLARKIIRLMGYMEPQYVRRNNRYFKLYHSSGPAPWCSDGEWASKQSVLEKWKRSLPSKRKNVWYDLHAT